MVKNKRLKNQHLQALLTTLFTLTLGMILFFSIDSITNVNAQTIPNAYDISQWQGNISNNQAAQLKNHINFMILKAENGGLTSDPSFNNDAQVLQNNNVPYGAYDYSLYSNEMQARGEADSLYDRAPNADFYVNDAEENDAGYDFNSATQAWANEMHRITTKPVVLYSGLYFMNHNITPETRNAYDALWLAAYSKEEPNPTYHYDLWQYTDSHYSPSLGQYVDASIFPYGNNKPLSFWTGNGVSNSNQGSINPSPNPVPAQPNQPANDGSDNDSSSDNNSLIIIEPSKPQPKPHHYRKNRNRQPVKQRTANHTNKTNQQNRVNKRNHVYKHKRIVYNPNYYRSTKIDYLKVTDRHGIGLYQLNGKYIGHANPGTILVVLRFKTYHYRTYGYMTRAIGLHWGTPDVFTSNKKYVRWYRYN